MDDSKYDWMILCHWAKIGRFGKRLDDSRPLGEDWTIRRTIRCLVQVFSVISNFVYILFASQYPTSRSEGSFLYDCLEEGLQIKKKVERFETKTNIETLERPEV